MLYGRSPMGGFLTRAMVMMIMMMIMAWRGETITRSADADVEGVRFAFAKSGPVDYSEVTMEIGRPVHAYTLRLVFDRSYYRRLTGDACGGGAHLAIFHSNMFRTSATLDVIENGRCARDIVDFSGARWEALLAVVQRPSLLDDAKHHVDGLWLIDPDDCTVPQCGWRYFLGTRHVFLADAIPLDTHPSSHVEGVEGCRMPLLDTASAPLGLLNVLAATTQTYVGWQNVTVTVGSGSDGGDASPVRARPYRLVIAPDAHTSYFPSHLFQTYFKGRNLFREDPSAWPDIHMASDACHFSISPRTIFPLSYMYPTTGAIQERFVALMMHRDVWVDDDGGGGELTHGKAAKGYNALKVHPHRADNDTIVLAGNVLWGNLGLSIDQVRQSAELVTYPHRRDLGVPDILYLALLSILYARWLLSGMWLDTCDTGQLYMVMLTNYGILGSAALALLKIVLGYPLYYAQVMQFADGLTAHHNADAYSIRALIGLSFAADGLLVSMALFVMDRALRHAARAFAASLADFFREWRSGGNFEDTKPDADWREHHHHPFVSERLPYRGGRWDPREHYARHARNRPFTWFWTETVACYTLLVDIVFTTAVWFVAAASDDVVIADAVTLVTFTVAVYTGMQYTVLLFETLKSMWHSGRWPHPRSVAALVLVACVTLALAIFTGYFIVKRMLDDYWTEYHGQAVDAVVIFYMLVLLLAAKLMVRHVFSVYIIEVAKRHQPTTTTTTTTDAATTHTLAAPQHPQVHQITSDAPRRSKRRKRL